MTIDQVKDYWDDRPCNIRHGQTSIDDDPLQYSREVTARKLRVEPHIFTFTTPQDLDGKHVLDLGCGIGTQSIMFVVWGAAAVSAVDVSQESIKIAKIRCAAEDEIHRAAYGRDMALRFYQQDIEDLPSLWSNTFDMVYSFGVIHHTPHPQRAIKEAFRVLKPGGEFRLMVYNRLSWKAFWIIMTYGKGRFWRWKELIPRYSEAQTGCPITWTYTPGEIRELLTTAGFVVDSIQKDHIFPYRIKDYIQHRYVKEWYWRLLPKPVFRWLERRLGWHLLVKAHRPPASLM